MPPLRIVNETSFDGRSVNACVRFVFRELALDGSNAVVKVKHHRGGHAYQGRFYPQAHRNGAHVYDYNRDEWRMVAPKIPAGYRHLLVCRIGPDTLYPCGTHCYDRRDSPGTWIVEDWREALVSIVGHEAAHLKQWIRYCRDGGERFNEVDTEWAAYRMWLRWREKNGCPASV